VPAAFNNIVGLKPTKGLMSTRGVVPACRTQDTVSIFALTVADACRVFSATSAFDPEDSFARRPLADGVTDLVSAPLRIGVPSAPLEFFGDVESARLYEAAVERVRALDATIVSIDFTPFQQAASLLYQGPWVAERLAAIKSFAAEKSPAIREVVRGIILGAEKLTAVSAFEGLYRLADLRRSAEAEWQKMDMLLLPTAPTIYTIADVLSDPLRLNSNLGLYTNFVNLMDLSALAIPAGFRADGLPFGVSLIGPAFNDKELAVIADRMHRSMLDPRLGATDCLLGKTSALETPVAVGNLIQLAVVGAHLCGQPLNRQLIERNARLVRTARTAPGYSFYALANTMPPKPGLVYDGKGLGGIEVEVWEMTAEEFGSFVALIPAPLGIGTLTLEDGTLVKGFLCESYAVEGAEDITSLGGWRAWIGRR
jgi:allophanate hydrolase